VASEDINGLLSAYLASAVRWGELQEDASAANKAFDETHRLYKLLRASPEGQQGIASLMNHERTGVRLLAATHSLAWAPKLATKTLEKIESGAGLHAVSTKYTLRSFRSGKLNLDW
jgi:hypothetical protein